MIYREKDFGPTLCHFNPNHDPDTGKFTTPDGKPPVTKLQRKTLKSMNSENEASKYLDRYMRILDREASVGKNVSSMRNNASVMYELISREHKKLDKYVDKLARTGDPIEGSAWQTLNKSYVELGERFIEKSFKEKALDTLLRYTVIPVPLAPSALGSSKYKMK